jgi:hypothetical protein
MLSLSAPPLEQALVQLVELNSPTGCGLALSSIVPLFDKALADPAKFGSIKKSAKLLQSRVLNLSGGAALLESMGFHVSDDSYTLDTSLGDTELQRRAVLVRVAAARFETVRVAIGDVGDSNAPATAVGAVKLAHVYTSNVIAHASDESKRRITSSNKALASRLLEAAGGAALLLSAGWAPEGEPTDAYACLLPIGELQVAAATLEKAEMIWADMAAASGADPAAGATGGGGGAAAAGASAVAQPIALSQITIATLPLESSLSTRPGNADMEPVLVSDEGRAAVLLLCWTAVSKRWRRVGWMQTPSTVFEWERPALGGMGPEPYELVIEVDLGDGKPLELGYHVLADGQPENEYLAANRFIGQHFEVLSSNHLEEIARDLRVRVAPVLETIKNLGAAMQAQN